MVSQATLKRIEQDRARVLNMIENADHFLVSIYSNHGFIKGRFETLVAAREYCPTVEAIAANHRKALVYVVVDGSIEIVPADLEPKRN